MSPPIGPGGFRAMGRRRRHPRPMSEINVTPFVDVMLVLLIVFMVTAPLLSAGVPVDLPETDAKPLAVEKQPVTVTIDPDGKIFVKDDEVAMDELVAKLTAVSTPGARRAHLRARRQGGELRHHHAGHGDHQRCGFPPHCPCFSAGTG